MGVRAMTPLFKKLNTATLVRAADGDAQLWMVYPKGSSKKYKCEFKSFL
jgi:hypothetical protein